MFLFPGIPTFNSTSNSFSTFFGPRGSKPLAWGPLLPRLSPTSGLWGDFVHETILSCDFLPLCIFKVSVSVAQFINALFSLKNMDLHFLKFSIYLFCQLASIILLPTFDLANVCHILVKEHPGVELTLCDIFRAAGDECFIHALSAEHRAVIKHSYPPLRWPPGISARYQRANFEVSQWW